MDILNDYKNDGNYALDMDDNTFALEVKSYMLAQGRYVVQKVLELSTGLTYTRVRSPDGTWRTSNPVTESDLNNVAAGGVGEASKDVSGLMSSARVRELEDAQKRIAQLEFNLHKLSNAYIDADALKGKKPEDFAASEHIHCAYATIDGLESALSQYVRREEYTSEALIGMLNGVLDKIDAEKFGGVHGLANREHVEAVAETLARVQNRVAELHEVFAKRDHKHDEYEPRAAKAKERKASNNIGNIIGGYFTPTLPLTRYVNAGAHTLVAPKEDGEYTLVVTNHDTKAGVISYEGLTVNNGESYLPSTGGAIYLLHITVAGPVAALRYDVVK